MSVESEDFEVGRKIGVVARKDRELYETVREVAKKRGKKMGDVLTEALELWRLYETLEDVDPKSFVASLSFMEHMLNKAVELLVKLGTVFTSEFFKQNMGLIAEFTKPPTEEKQEKQQTTQTPTNIYKDQVKAMMMQSLIPMLMSIVQQLVATVSKVNIQPPPTQPQPTPKLVIEE